MKQRLQFGFETLQNVSEWGGFCLNGKADSLGIGNAAIIAAYSLFS